MDFLTAIGRKITGMAKTATKKSEDMVEITKMNLAIGNEEDRIKRSLYEIGSDIYKDFVNGKVEGEYYNNKCIEIKQVEDNIKVLKEKILWHRGRKTCKTCSTIVDLGDNFCPNCGSDLNKS